MNFNLKKANADEAAQSNKLIEASYKMSVPAKRVMLMLIAQINPCWQDISQKIRIEASDYSRKTGIALSQSYLDIKNGCRELMKTIIITHDLTRKTTSECVVVSWMEYHKNEGWLEATFTPWIYPYLHSLSRLGYTKIRVDEALKFKRFYSVRLYELLMQWKSTGERHISLSNLRKSFQIDVDKYKKFSDFRKWVLEPSVKEITEKTSWEISWEPLKTHRKVSSISFLFLES
jgi:plasmid replication initiation protein